ncbi:hypothetical protein OQA88_7003 [Cercophora sp. LCS_1]
MPISRKKACAPCRESKARCNLQLPCSRCSDRGLRCTYERIPVFQGPYPSPRPIASRPPQSLGSYDGQTEQTLWGWDSILTHSGIITEDPHTVSTLDQWFETGPGDLAGAMPEVEHRHGACEESHPGTAMVAADIETDTLSRRKPKNPETYLTSKVVFGQLTSYPAMMVDGKGRLPPFIHPQCVLDGKPMDECRSQGNGNHTCFSETLAVCVSLLHVFFTRTETSSDYVWRTIYRHQEELHDKLPTLKGPQIVEVMQAVVLYMLIQALDPQSIPRNNVPSLVRTVKDVGSSLHDLRINFSVADADTLICTSKFREHPSHREITIVECDVGCEVTTALTIFEDDMDSYAPFTFLASGIELIESTGITPRPAETETTDSSARSDRSLSTGAKVGLGLGIPLSLFIISAVIAAMFWHRRRQQSQIAESAVLEMQDTQRFEKDGEAQAHTAHELDATPMDIASAGSIEHELAAAANVPLPTSSAELLVENTIETAAGTDVISPISPQTYDGFGALEEIGTYIPSPLGSPTIEALQSELKQVRAERERLQQIFSLQSREAELERLLREGQAATPREA